MSAGRPAAVTYREPARGYTSAVLLFVLLVAGWVLDSGLSHGAQHWPGWLIAIVVVVGIDVITTRAARASRSIVLTTERLAVGDTSIDRSLILGIERNIDGALPVLGRPNGAGLPRGTPGLAVHLVDGGTIIVPTRHPSQLAGALAVLPHAPEIRRAVDADLPQLVEIEQRAATVYRVGGWGDSPAISFGERLAAPIVVLVAGRSPIGFARLEEIDGAAHLAGLSVLPGSMRQGVGGALLDAACAWATAHGFAQMTLTCFVAVPWNAPFFARHGFERWDDPGPDLLELRDWERSQGLDELGERIVMRRVLHQAS